MLHKAIRNCAIASANLLEDLRYGDSQPEWIGVSL
jgi:hypothetical protein